MLVVCSYLLAYPYACVEVIVLFAGGVGVVGGSRHQNGRNGPLHDYTVARSFLRGVIVTFGKQGLV